MKKNLWRGRVSFRQQYARFGEPHIFVSAKVGLVGVLTDRAVVRVTAIGRGL